MPQQQFHSIGSLAQALGVQIHKIDYVLTKLGIAPVGRCGGYRLFSDDALNAIAEELERIARRKAERGAS